MNENDTNIQIPAPGCRVRFREGTPQRDKIGAIEFIVKPSPSGADYSLDATVSPSRHYVWLVLATDIDKPPSRQLQRTGYADALEVIA